jgi:hypothetical protein
MLRKPTINEDRLFKKLPFFFDRPASVLLELAQNAQRSGATMLNLTVLDNVLTASDDGEGCTNPEALLVLAESDWSEETELNANPAGWGLMFLICLSRSVTFKSAFGSLTVDAETFLDDGEYRATILNRIDRTDSCAGFLLSAHLKDNVAEALLCKTNDLRFFPLDITINEDRIKRTTLGEELSIRDRNWLHLDYQGNKVYIAVSQHLPASIETLRENITCIWYGISIHPARASSYVYIDVTGGSPLTPVLPYRTDIREDEKLAAFYEFVRKEVVAYCTKDINSNADASDTALIERMKTMSSLATQEELDRLDRFHYRTFQENNLVDRYFFNDDRLIARTDPAPISETVDKVSVMDKTGVSQSYEMEALVVPENLFIEVSLPDRRPAWLTVQERHFNISVHCADIPRGLNYDWAKAKISCEGKALPVLALISGSEEGIVFYSDDPRDAYDIQAAIFEVIYSEDFEADSRETQRDNFDEAFDRDIMKITGKYSRSDLLAGFDSLGIKMEKAVSIALNKSLLVIKFADGSRKNLKLA